MSNVPEIPEHIELSVSEAAEYFGLSKNAIRKRLQRGKIDEFKVDQGTYRSKKNEDGEWRIIVEAYANGVANDVSRGIPHRETDQPGTNLGQSQEELALFVAEQNLAVFRDAFVMPLVERIGELERELGRVERENEYLKERVGELQSVQEEPAPKLEPITLKLGQPKWWQFWRYYR